jgi:hypothetical protein
LRENGEESSDEDEDLMNDPDFQKMFRDYKNKYYEEKLECGEVTGYVKHLTKPHYSS